MLNRPFLLLSLLFLLLTLLPATLTIQCSGNTVLRNYQCIACPTGTISQQNQCILLSSSYYGSNISPYPYIVQVCASDEILINGRCFKKNNVNAWIIWFVFRFILLRYFQEFYFLLLLGLRYCLIWLSYWGSCCGVWCGYVDGVNLGQGDVDILCVSIWCEGCCCNERTLRWNKNIKNKIIYNPNYYSSHQLI